MKLLPKRAKPQTGRQRSSLGSGRPQAFSYHANRNEQDYNLGRQQPRDQDTRRRERIIRYWRQRLGALVALIAIVGCLVDILVLSSSPRVIPLTEGSGTSFLQPTATYQQAAGKLFASSIFNANKVTINTAGITADLQHQFPELSAVSVTLPLIGHRPIIYIAPTTPSLILKSHSGTYVLDNNGKALLSADKVADLANLKLPTVTDDSDLVVKTDAVALPSSSVAFIRTVADQLAAKQVPIDSLTLAATAYELDVHPSGVGYFVKFNLHDDQALQQVGTFLAVKQRLDAQGITASSYIDVRIDGRAYYK
jgi:hypothetical protein